MTRGHAPHQQRHAVSHDCRSLLPAAKVGAMVRLLAEAEGCLMGVFRFHLIGACKHVDIEVSAATIGDLNKDVSGSRFVEGRLVEPDGDGVLLGMLIATSRIECVVELS